MWFNESGCGRARLTVGSHLGFQLGCVWPASAQESGASIGRYSTRSTSAQPLGSAAAAGAWDGVRADHGGQTLPWAQGMTVSSVMMVGMLSVVAAFEDFRGNLEITGLQESVVAARQDRVRAAVARVLVVRDSFLTGSYRRRTLIAPVRDADVDIMVVLDRSYRRRGPQAVLDLVKDTLREEYRSSEISRNGQAVTIRFSDFTVDVVPAFASWWDSSVLDICNSSDDSWIRTSPQKHIDISSKINQRTAGLLVPSVKMLKAWNRTTGRPLRGFHLEVLAWKVFDPGWFSAAWWGPGIGMGSDAENLGRFFAEAPGWLRRRLRDPARDEGDLGAYLTDRGRDEVISRLDTAASRCQRAAQLLADGDIADANVLYRKVFGDAFPS
jgi:Second Messenger Oligonucleotide or Dinucleotide Synthetase domain